jgi:outer membrane protein assembly factor BamB
MLEAEKTKTRRHRVYWWLPALVVGLAIASILYCRNRSAASFQERNLQTLSIVLGAALVLLLWWVTAGPAAWRTRLWTAGAFLGAIALTFSLFRISGVSGDLLPVLEPRWKPRAPVAASVPAPAAASQQAEVAAADFPQFLGPARTAMLAGPKLKRDWVSSPPAILWRQPVGAGWSGCAVVGKHALTMEQRPEGECTSCYEAGTGRLIWSHADPVHYESTIAGEGPRCTPTVAGSRVFSLGATGILNCFELATGKLVWTRQIAKDAGASVPEWGYAGSPLVLGEKVIVSAGGSPDRSLIAYQVESGEIAWAQGSQPASYSSPFLAELCGVQQILAFNSRKITAHEALTGRLLWEYPWGIGHPQVAVPIVVSSNQVVFSSGYGVGSELLQLEAGPDGRLTPVQVWRSRKLKAKFANIVLRDGYLYGLDDGVLACLDIKDGSQPWKEGRYGHGQGLLVGELFLLMAESGELVLLQPTPQGPNELHRFRVFTSKTWNPIALAGDLLFARNDREAACLRLAVESAMPPAATPLKY